DAELPQSRPPGLLRRVIRLGRDLRDRPAVVRPIVTRAGSVAGAAWEPKSAMLSRLLSEHVRGRPGGQTGRKRVRPSKITEGKGRGSRPPRERVSLALGR